MNRPLPGALLVFGALTLFGCASVDVDSMASIDSSGLSRHPEAVALDVTSEVEGYDLEGADLLEGFVPATEDVAAAIRRAILDTGFFADVRDDASLRLSAVLRQTALVDRTDREMTRSVRAVINWSLDDGEGEEPLWWSRVATTCTRTFADDFNGYERTAAAVEGAIRDNIRKALGELEASGVLAGRDDR